ncbi:MAG TPA: hypothetical protein VF103_16880, partial [Polyangiaceae bacterium]
MRAFRVTDRWFLAWALAFAPALFVAWFLALAPTVDPDGLAYHLTVPKRWLEAGSLVYLPTYIYSNTPMGLEMLFMSGLALGGDVAAKLVHFGLGVTAAIGLYLAGVRLRGPVTGILAPTAYLVGPAGVGSLLGCAYLEGGIALAMVGSVLAWLVWFRGGGMGFLRAAFLASGIAASFKLTAILFPIALGALTLVVLHERVGTRVVLDALGLVPFIALPVAPWFVRAAIVTGNPFFPLFAGIFPSRDYSPVMGARLEHYARYFFWGSRLDWGLERRKILLAVVALVVAAAGAVAFFRLRTRAARAAAVVVAAIVLVQISATGLYVRYWIPMLAVLCLPIFALFEGVLTGARQRVAVVAVTALLSLYGARSNLASVGNDVGGLARAAFGLEERRAFLARHIPLYPMYEHANRELPPSSHILLTYYCGGFYLDRTTLCGEFIQESLRWTTWDVFAKDMAKLGVTHVFAPKTFAEGGPAPPRLDKSSPSILLRPKQEEFLTRMLRGHARLLISASDQGLYEIEPLPEH